MPPKSIFKRLPAKRILVTGCSGQIGSNLVRKLNDHGIKVTGLDNRPIEKLLNMDYLNCDITNINELKKVQMKLSKIDTLVHLASTISDSQDIINDAIPSIDLNILGTLNLLEYLPSLRYVCFSSSYMVYGPAEYNPVDEGHQTNPINIYGANKLAAEKFLNVWSKNTSAGLGVLRLMGVYGPGTPASSGRAIPAFIERVSRGEPPVIYGKGISRRNYIYIDDCVDAIIRCVLESKPGVWNIGGKDAWSVNEIAETVIRISGMKVKPAHRWTDAPETDFICSMVKTRKDIGFIPTTSMTAGLKNQLDDYTKNRGRGGP